jgi:[acyl-carrier-protein] S-malonyltransferase
MSEPATALLFAGQGSEHVGMGATLSAECAACATILRKPDDILGIPLWDLMANGPEADLHKTALAQPALLALAVAEARHLLAGGVRPVALLGHSLGQYAALVVANALSLGEALRLVRARGRLMQEAVPLGLGAMAAVMKLPRAQVQDACSAAQRGTVVIACHNAADETVISGHVSAVEEAADVCEEAGAIVALLPASAPFHSPLLGPMLPSFARALDDVEFRDPDLLVIDNVTAAPLRTAAQVRHSLYEQIEAPVRFEEGLRWLLDAGVARFVGCGPGRSVIRLARIADRTATTVPFSEVQLGSSFIHTESTTATPR